MSIKSLFAASLAAAALLAQPAMAQDGAALFTAKNCHTCHGAAGKAPMMPLYPKLAGQNAAYLEAQSKMIRDGQRSGGMSVAMKAMVASVTDAEFKAIAEWLATQ